MPVKTYIKPAARASYRAATTPLKRGPILACRFSLAAWLCLSLSCWLWLNNDGLIAITPWVGMIMLVGVGISLLYSATVALRFETAPTIRACFRSLQLAAVMAPWAAISLGLIIEKALETHPSIDLSAAFWLLASAGFALTQLVSVLILTQVETANGIDDPL